MRRARNTGAKRYRLFLALCCGLAIVPLTGCQSMGGGARGENRPSASAVRDPVLEDIPKPSGFMLVDDGSFGVFAGKVRIARCEYVGSTGRSAVKQFYEEYMPSAGFELRQWSLDNGVFDLRFESSAEVCTVRVHPTEWNKTALVVEIGPKPHGSVEHESQPPLSRPQ